MDAGSIRARLDRLVDGLGLLRPLDATTRRASGIWYGALAVGVS